MKMINETHIEGLLYEHNLKVKVTGEKSKNPGTTFITGDISIATDEECTNIVPIHFSYVTPCWGNTSKENANFGILKNIANGIYHSVMEHGKDNALRLNVDSSIALNEFYSDRNGQEELVSVKRNEGGFIHILSKLNEDKSTRDTFKCDMLITKVREVEANIESGQPAKAIVKGYIFDYRKAILPVEFTAVNPAAINYFIGLEATEKEPTFTWVKGHQVSETIVKTITEESAFGPADVREVSRSYKDFVITGAKPIPYEWDDENTYTAAQLKEAMTNRETYLATLKQRQDDYKASKNQAAAAPTTGAFQF